jgi:AbrB family looped-hinge helix DNA binding protein
MRLTSKGQVTIPHDIRAATGILPGTEVEFAVEGDAVVIRRARGGDGDALVARLRGRGDVAMSTDEIMALTRS